MSPHYTKRALGLALVVALVGCGGGGGGSSPPETLQASADAATTRSGEAVLIDVRANDRASAGSAITLAAISTAPAQGTAAIDGERVRYTPKAGYFGADSFAYQVTLASGATANAQVSVQVSMPLRLTGTVTDDPLAGAQVELRVGDQRFTATTDAQGRYRIDANLTDPTVMASVSAAGVGAQAGVRLSSQLGGAARLAAAATAGALDEAALPAARVTHLSTAMDVLATEANSGTAPATDAALQTAQARVDTNQALELAAAIKVVVGGTALPAGVADTRALVASPAARDAFLSANFLAVLRAQLTLATDVGLGLAAAPVAAGEAPRVLRYFYGRGSAYFAWRVRYAADGTARVLGGQVSGERDARWTLENGEIAVRFVVPQDVSTTGFTTNPPQREVTRTIRTHALFIRPLAGATRAGAVQLAAESEDLEDGVVKTPRERGTPALMQQRDAAAAQVLTEADFPSGAVWSGPGFGSGTTGFMAPFGQDLVEFRTGGQASQRFANLALTWQVVDGGLVLSRAGGERLRYERLAALADGEERWWVEHWPAGATAADKAFDMLVVKQDPTLVFTEANLLGHWRSSANVALTADRFYVHLKAGSEIRTINVLHQPPAGIPAVTDSLFGSWSLTAAGRMFAHQTPVASAVNVREWTPLARRGNKLMVMEWRAIGAGNPTNPDRGSLLRGYRNNIYYLDSEAR